ncbi:hypothetical protein DMC25_08145 [Caulobacter sp. D4A]|uniref:hypothetical protein n=1 Tax=unclassified Caulobacter TaxID=2648921 RepID=UPI000D72E828|nr:MULTISPECIES: hypothetical protein [unclassified Caulobacter]PXA85285.1 hypothetical protein DMC18_23085 [Caulobacter sp. D5]PXA90221.1 hypothetical protein DMC25_08145 [Caulobacter sp. D4A]
MATDINTEHSPTLKATRARQGRWGRHIFWVLVISTVLAAIALFGAWGMRSGDLASVQHNTGADTPAEAAQGTTVQTAPKQTPGEKTAPAH